MVSASPEPAASQRNVAGPVERIAFLGTPELAVPPLRALADAGYDIALVVSRADARRGRRGEPTPSPVKAAALELGLSVTDDLADLAAIEVDVAVVVAYGRIIPTALLDRCPFLNLHFSLLPRWRGAAPVERAILAGDEVTGVCLMDLEPELDTGAVHRRTETPIGPDESLEELRGRLVEIGTEQLLAELADGLGTPVPQEGEPVYAAKITTADREIDWDEPPVVTHRRVRVGGAFTTWQGKRFKIHRTRLVDDEAPGVTVATGAGTIELLEVQPEGKPRMQASAWANGAHWQPGDRFGS